MIVIVSNKQKSVLDNANIDAIKDLNGVFNVQDLINNFKNYFFTKMVIDATSIVDFTNPEVLRQLASGIGSEKLVVLLPPKPEPPLRFLETLVNIGIYNFSTNIDELIQLISNPHDKDSINRKIHNLGPASSANNVMSGINSNTNSNSVTPPNAVPLEQGLNNIENINAINPVGVNTANSVQNIPNLNSVQPTQMPNNDMNMNMNNMNQQQPEEKKDMISLSDFVLSENSIGNNPQPNQNVESGNINGYVDPNGMPQPVNDMNGGQQFNMNVSTDINQVAPINNGNTFLNNNQQESFINGFNQTKALVVGFRNVTEHAGTTTLIYKLKETLENRNHKHIALVEVGTNDLSFFRLAEAVSIQENELDNCLKNYSTRYDYVFVDLCQTTNDSICDFVLYLVEPTKIKINKLIVKNRNIFNELKGKYVVLNKSMLSDNERGIFSQEANLPFFASVMPFNDRKETNALDELINKIEGEKNNSGNNSVPNQNQTFISF